MTKNLRIEYKPHDKQKLFHASGKKFRSFIGGVGSGKTYAGCWEALRMAFDHPGTLGIVVAPTYKMLEDATIRTFKSICPREIADFDGRDYNRTKKILTLCNGSQIFFRSSDEPDNLRGPTISWFWLDEAAMMPEYAWDIMIGRIREKEGVLKGIVTTTPKGFNWLYRVFVEKGDDDYQSIHATTRDNEANLPPSYIRAMENKYVGAFHKQELLGQFVGFEGLVYPEFNPEVHITSERGPFQRVIAGVDFGFTNPLAISVVGLDSDERAFVIDEFYETGIADITPIVKDFRDRYNIEMFYCDKEDPKQIQQLNNNGISAIGAENSILLGIQEVSGRLKVQGDGRPRIFINEGCVNTINELQQYRYPETKEGKPTQENPLKVFDHLMDALRYALISIKRAEVQLAGGFVRGDFR